MHPLQELRKFHNFTAYNIAHNLQIGLFDYVAIETNNKEATPEQISKLASMLDLSEANLRYLLYVPPARSTKLSDRFHRWSVKALTKLLHKLNQG